MMQGREFGNSNAQKRRIYSYSSCRHGCCIPKEIQAKMFTLKFTTKSNGHLVSQLLNEWLSLLAVLSPLKVKKENNDHYISQ